MGFNRKQVCLIIIILAAIFITLGCIIASVDTLELLRVGLAQSDYAKSLDSSTLYSPGRYFLGLGLSFVTFPSTTQVLVFSDTALTEKEELQGAKFQESSRFYNSISVRTLEGLKVTADVLVYYKLGYPDDPLELSEQIAYLYEALDGNYDKFVEMVTILELRNVIGGYTAAEFITLRRDINEAFKTKLRSSLSEDYILLTTASISNLKFPEEYEEAVEETIIAQQNVTTMGYYKDEQQVYADTDVLAADKDSEMVLKLAQAEGDDYYRQAEALASATEYTFAQKSQAVDSVMTNLDLVDDFKFTKAEKVLTYFWIYLQLGDNMNVTSKYINTIKSYELNLIDAED